MSDDAAYGLVDGLPRLGRVPLVAAHRLLACHGARRPQRRRALVEVSALHFDLVVAEGGVGQTGDEHAAAHVVGKVETLRHLRGAVS